MSLAFPPLSGKNETPTFMGAVLSPEAGACGHLRCPRRSQGASTRPGTAGNFLLA